MMPITNYPEEDSILYYFRDISKYKPLSAEEEKHLAALIRKGDRYALEKLVKANLKFVVSVALQYQNQGLLLSDLINEGNMGLIHAALKFDAKKNFKFISYAVWWIRQSILQALANQSRLFKAPLNQVCNLYKIGKAQQRLEQELQRKPNKYEIAAECNISSHQVDLACLIDAKNVSLDNPVNHQKSNAISIKDTIEDPGSVYPDEEIIGKSSRESLKRVLNVLGEREKQVITLYYGLDNEEPQTLDTIGNRLGITRERVRQIRDKALKLLKMKAVRKLYEETVY